ncbi:TetR/AcrR family transcriptional regulator [Actinomadura fibrosa]|uniref:TetR/AcrR family transcriptional regulator n=1 Tax=Actinomadura fibrosa TaxID=111802 RepID=A0ABW2XUU3_9ACTN|nr:TetR/AcrR family transcriptional regulator [Actinomadura fibrosa]
MALNSGFAPPGCVYRDSAAGGRELDGQRGRLGAAAARSAPKRLLPLLAGTAGRAVIDAALPSVVRHARAAEAAVRIDVRDGVTLPVRRVPLTTPDRSDTGPAGTLVAGLCGKMSVPPTDRGAAPMADASPKPRLRAPARRALITAAAVRIFAEKGYHGTSLGEIAAAAGVARTVLYDHFPSKRVLLLAVMQEENAALIEYVGARITASGSAEERMRSTIDAYFGFAQNRPEARSLLFDRTGEDDPEIRVVRQGIRESRTHAVAALLADDIRTVGVEPGEPIAEAMVEFVITGLDGVAQWWERNPETPRATLVEGAMRLLWTGLGGGS